MIPDNILNIRSLLPQLEREMRNTRFLREGIYARPSPPGTRIGRHPRAGHQLASCHIGTTRQSAQPRVTEPLNRSRSEAALWRRCVGWVTA